jgi:CDGSH-type Zn-finger protein
MASPSIAAKQPVSVAVEAGKTYAWCACGLSKKQPFCDGSHKPTAFKPMIWKAEKDQAAWFCQCKHTKNAPMCDGTHKTV